MSEQHDFFWIKDNLFFLFSFFVYKNTFLDVYTFLKFVCEWAAGFILYVFSPSSHQL